MLPKASLLFLQIYLILPDQLLYVANLFRSLDSEKGGVFKDERVLLPEYLPDVLPHREKELKDIAVSLKPASEGRKPDNLLVVGTPGVGKTSSVRHVLKELSEYSKRAITVYINCWEFSTRHGVLGELARACGEVLPQRGISASEIFDRIAQSLKRDRRVALVALDEIDRLSASGAEDNLVLYDFMRAKETFGVEIGFIGITNDEDFLSKLEPRVRSSLNPRLLCFKRYSPQQLKDILNERARLAFFSDALDKEVVPVCAAFAGKNHGDARLALHVLWQSGREAEKQGVSRVLVSHAKKALQNELPQKSDKMEVVLTDIEEKIVSILKKQDSITSGELYELLGENDRTVRNHLARLDMAGIIETELLETSEKLGGKGKTRLIKLKKRT